MIFSLAACAFPLQATEGGASYPEIEGKVFLSEEAALKLVFPGCDRVDKISHVINKEEKAGIEARLGWALSQSSVTVYHGFAKGLGQGRAVIAEEIGKFKPITFIVKVSENGTVERVDVMVYREAVGEEVRRGRFTRQFRGKSVKDPLRINRDILNVTGATMSVQAMTAGVKKVLAILEEIHE